MNIAIKPINDKFVKNLGSVFDSEWTQRKYEDVINFKRMIAVTF